MTGNMFLLCKRAYRNLMMMTMMKFSCLNLYNFEIKSSQCSLLERYEIVLVSAEENVIHALSRKSKSSLLRLVHSNIFIITILLQLERFSRFCRLTIFLDVLVIH